MQQVPDEDGILNKEGGTGHLPHPTPKARKVCKSPDEVTSKLEAQRKADEAKADLEKARLKKLKYQNKASRSKERWGFLKKHFTTKRAIACVTVLIITVAAGVFGISWSLRGRQETTYLSSAQLEEIVNISKLSSAEYTYNGVAEIRDANGNVTQRIYYESRVSAGIDMGGITFDVDNEAKTASPVLPDITIYDPSVDESSFEYMPSNPSMSLTEIISACKNDARSEIESHGQIYQTARENLESTITALTLPLLEDYGYTIEWNTSVEEEASETPQENQADAVSEGGASDEQ